MPIREEIPRGRILTEVGEVEIKTNVGYNTLGDIIINALVNEGCELVQRPVLNEHGTYIGTKIKVYRK